MYSPEDVIRACELETRQVEQVRDTYKKAVKERAARTFGWHSANDIQKVTGLEGRFLWTEDLLAPATIRFKFDPTQVGSVGTYTLVRAGITVEQADFFSVPNNPLIGFAAIVLTPQGGSNQRGFVIQGMMADNNWFIYNMSLEKIGPQGLVPPEFWVVRQM
jgi:hypothetical protein